MDFVTLDFETATSSGDSPCEIGLTFVKNGQVEKTYGRLIRPPGNRFDFWNIKVHGIRPEEVENEPSFAEVWEDILPMINNRFMIAHNASFDFGVLKKSLDANKLSYPAIQYACSLQISRKVWTGLPKYNLKYLSDLHGISLNHHRAVNDSEATAYICLKAFEDSSVCSPEEIETKLHAGLKKFGEPVITSFRSRMRSLQKKQYPVKAESPATRRPGHPFYGKKVVFTGTLSSMNRLEALQEILNLGGIPEEKVEPDTDFLILGKEHTDKSGKPYLSRKLRKACEFKAKGFPVRVLSEREFFEILKS
jgi:DNA polymerase-3 subunit epsilon